jgi:hypothetical protein
MFVRSFLYPAWIPPSMLNYIRRRRPEAIASAKPGSNMRCCA